MNSIEVARQTLDKLLDKMGIEASITEETMGDKQVLAIESESHKLLIGKGGENLRSLEYLVNAIARRQIEDYRYVNIDVAGYKREKEDRLRAIATDAAERAVKTGSSVHLRPMNSYERRIVHTELAQKPEIQTRSQGEEPYRSIVVEARD